MQDDICFLIFRHKSKLITTLNDKCKTKKVKFNKSKGK
jgi:hypothetical protein